MNKRHFTLIELMAAMVVLLIMMGFLFHFIINSQNLWSASERNARIYENAQVFFDLLDRDLGGAMASKVPGQEICFWIGDPSDPQPANLAYPDEPFLSMVSAAPPLDGASEPNVYEIHYKLEQISPAANNNYRIKRSVVRQTGADAADWDFYGVPAGNSLPTWVASRGGTETEVIDGVGPAHTSDTDFPLQVVCLDAAGNTISTGSSYAQLPAAIRVTVTLVDQKAMELGLGGTALTNRLDASRRKFTRVFLLSH
jgi:type II secretory pathway component PulJ